MSKNVNSGCVIIYFFIALFGIGGWGQNVYKLIQCDFDPINKAEVIRGVGVFVPPVGVIVGWMDIEDTPTKVSTVIIEEK